MAAIAEGSLGVEFSGADVELYRAMTRFVKFAGVESGDRSKRRQEEFIQKRSWRKRGEKGETGMSRKGRR
jgi:hypothetical protein